jgi:bifunctional lysine-specific demethylase and histidyl-hydroxylase MINA
MLPGEAERVLQGLFGPLPLDTFIDDVLERRFLHLKGDDNHRRRNLLGNNPAQVLLDAYATLSPAITHHAALPTGPAPTIEAMPDAEAFAGKIEALHDRGYTVRFPDVRPLTPALQEMMRALECVLHRPADAVVFWSRDDGKAPVHHDNTDLIVIQMVGRKRWFVSKEPSPLPNDWEPLPKLPPRLDNPEVLEVGPGDLLYLPRGTTHSVEAMADSIHLSLSFTPLTLREAIIACLDHLSDLDKPLRAGVAPRLAAQVRSGRLGHLPAQVREGVNRLGQICAADNFISDALQRHSARAVGDLEKLKYNNRSIALTPRTRVRRNPLAIAHLTSNGDKIDFAYPGGHRYVHRGAEKSIVFIAGATEFQVSDIPGEVGDDIRLALVEEFVSCGFLEVIEG